MQRRSRWADKQTFMPKHFEVLWSCYSMTLGKAKCKDLGVHRVGVGPGRILGECSILVTENSRFKGWRQELVGIAGEQRGHREQVRTVTAAFSEQHPRDIRDREPL